MIIDISNYTFEGPYASADDLKDQSGVYVILGKNGDEPPVVIDVGESGEVKTRISNHDRKSCWSEQRKSPLSVAVFYTDKSSRMVIEQEIRQQYNPVCGVR